MVTSVKNKEKDDVNMVVAVHVKGEDKNPGYYELDYGSRVKDAVDKAGGTTNKANLNGVNLAAKILDGDEIIIPAKASGVVAGESATQTSETAININTADINLLCTLEGIGTSTAEAIINYRTNKGAFMKIEDIKKVEGIGNAKFDAIKDKITV